MLTIQRGVRTKLKVPANLVMYLHISHSLSHTIRARPRILMSRDRPTRHIRPPASVHSERASWTRMTPKQKPQPAAVDVAHQPEVLTPATLAAQVTPHSGTVILLNGALAVPARSPLRPVPAPEQVARSRGRTSMSERPYELTQTPAGMVARVRLRGSSSLSSPLINRGTAFAPRERHALGLTGLLPSGVSTMEGQLRRTYAQYSRQPDDVNKNVYLAKLRDRNEVLFYRLLTEHIQEMLPIVYTPTIGQAIERFSHEFRRTRGCTCPWTRSRRGGIASQLRDGSKRR